MTKHEIASLASKLLGIYFAVHSLIYLSAMATQLSLVRGSDVGFSYTFLYSITSICFVVSLGVAYLLFFRSEKAATIFVGADGLRGTTNPIRGQEIQVVAFSAIGLFMTMEALPQFLNHLMNVVFSLAGWMYRGGVNRITYIYLATSLLQTALGVWVLFGASGVVNLVRKIRGQME